MADAPSTASYLTVTTENPLELPGARVLAGSRDIVLNDAGVGNTYTINTQGNVNSIGGLAISGYVKYNSSLQQFTNSVFGSDSSIAITNPDGIGGNATWGVNPRTSLQNIEIYLNSNFPPDVPDAIPRSRINLVPSGAVSITRVDNPANIATDIEIFSPVSAPISATYILQTPDVSLPGSQALNEVVTGLTNYLAKVHTASGVVSAAAPDVDYVEATPVMRALNNPAYTQPTPGAMLQGAGSFFVTLPIGPAGTVTTSNGTGFTWEPPASGVVGEVLAPTTVSVNMLPNICYVPTSTTGLVTFHLPLPIDCVPGQIFKIKGDGSSGWRINAGIALQSIRWGSLVTVDMGHIASTSPQDSIEMICVTPETFTIDVLLGVPDVV